MDVWLREHLTEIANTETLENELGVGQETPETQSRIHVAGEHPTYEFNIGEIIVVVSSDIDPFWMAQVTEVTEEQLKFQYYNHNTPKEGKKMTWHLDDTEGACGITDVYMRFKSTSEIFTKTNSIRTTALKRIRQACMKYNALEVPDDFK